MRRSLAFSALEHRGAFLLPPLPEPFQVWFALRSVGEQRDGQWQAVHGIQKVIELGIALELLASNCEKYLAGLRQFYASRFKWFAPVHISGSLESADGGNQSETRDIGKQ